MDALEITNEKEFKQKFGVALLKNPENPFKAALEAFDDNDTAKALYVSRHWVKDPLVIKAQKEFLKTNGDSAFLPTKGDVCKTVYDLSQEKGSTVKEKLDSLKFYAELMNYIPRPDTNVQINNNNVNQKVLVVPHYGSDEEWEQKVKEQQERLRNE